MTLSNRLYFFIIAAFATITVMGNCSYKFRDVAIDQDLKTVRVQLLINRAPYVNPQLSANLTEGVKRKILNQTRLSQTNSDNAHFDISGSISDYSVSTSAISDKQEVNNRLTVSVHIVANNTLKNEVKEFDISRNFEFDAKTSLQAAEARLLEEIIRTLSDDIFNRLFSNW
jgi:outer membrane lipopolysaccharide assembly protein LptE/RlpB